jgi:glutathione S-transferase
MTYDFWYWDGIPGRGEFVRLALEAGKIPYNECARKRGADIEKDMQRRRKYQPFAPPYLDTGTMVIAQTANILLYLGEHHGLAPIDPAEKFWVHQLQLTIADMVTEAHDVHHPVAGGLYYEDQKKEAARRAEDFRETRIPKFLSYFERALSPKKKWLSGAETWSYADLSLFQVVEGLKFTFPKRLRSVLRDYPNVVALHRCVKALPELKEYLKSKRRLPFGDGIFRHYPELDAA